MTENSLYKKDSIKYILLVIFGLIILGNTNNNPEIFVQRVFRPLKFGDVTFFYAGLIPLIIIYKGLKGIYTCNKAKILGTRCKRIIATIVLIVIFSNCWIFGLKTFKGFVGGLDSIYCDREDLWLHARKVNENEVKLSVIINLENCSSEKQEFYIKIKTPEEWKDSIIEDEILAKEVHSKPSNKIYMDKNESRNFRIEATITCKSSSYAYNSRRTNNFDFILFNDKEEVVFKGINSLR
ncbi:hypothetical protein R9X47_28365 [Wukongibacter baidiensis]|uniref:hypothetical protein n=1 Tax=Wukongibacter baidiensis TaxID=1723361 RepID=UPI003D7F717E